MAYSCIYREFISSKSGSSSSSVIYQYTLHIRVCHLVGRCGNRARKLLDVYHGRKGNIHSFHENFFEYVNGSRNLNKNLTRSVLCTWPVEVRLEWSISLDSDR